MRTFHCPRWPGCCPDGAVRHDCPALAGMMRRESDRGNWLDRSCNWMAENPWRICALILACIFVTSCLDSPDMSRSEAIAISAIVAGE